jgi:hypothetical protein
MAVSSILALTSIVGASQPAVAERRWFADLAVGAPFESLFGIPRTGTVTVLLGSANGLAGAGSSIWSLDQPSVLGNAELDDQFRTTPLASALQ